MADFDGWSLTIEKDCMSAILYMEPPHERDPYTVDETLEYIKNNGVVNGVLYSAVEEAIELRLYYKNVHVAEGKKPVDGIDGYYEFFFDRGNLKSPVIRSDGSVDYSSMTVVKSVKQGDKLAEYHPAIPGEQGMDVKGRELRCRPGKELPKLSGKGFDFDPDTNTYTALTGGRVDQKDYRLEVCDRYEHKGDLDLVTGRIDFRGDVVVHGNVRSGTLIRASKSITVEGSVESATLIAEGDIILKKGMQGGSRAKIVCGGDLYANFIEFTDVSVKGSIEANVILNSNISAGKSIKISGKRGSVVGGMAYAVGVIDTTNLGNQAEIKTLATVGVTPELEKRNHVLHVKAEGARDGIRRARAEIEVIQKSAEDSKEVKEAKCNQLKRHIQRDERMLEHISDELAEITSTMNLGRNAVINVSGKTYPGTNIRVGSKSLSIADVKVGTCYYETRDEDKVMTRNI